MPQTPLTSPNDGDQAVASHISQFVAPLHNLEDWRDGAGGQAAGGNLNIGSNKLINVGTPTAASDGATKNYVDTHPQLPTADQKAALAGSAETPNASNKYVTQSDRNVDIDAMRFRDDFIGARDARWGLTGTGASYTQNSEVGGTGSLSTGATSGNEAILSLAGKGCTDKSVAPDIEVRGKISSTTAVEAVMASLWLDDNNKFETYYDSAAGPNWKYRCVNGGTSTVVDSGLAANTSYHYFQITVANDGLSATFTVDQANSQVISTNLPTGLLEPRIRVKTTENVDKSLTVDLVNLHADR